MTAKEAIASLRTLCHTCEMFPKCVNDKPECFQAIELAISALQSQEANHSTESSLTQKALDTISRQDAIDVLGVFTQADALGHTPKQIVEALPSAQLELHWTPVGKKLPRINQRVLLASSGGTVFIGNRCKPELIWQVTEEDGRKHWVYDPEDYTDDIDSLPKGEDCAFEQDSRYGDAMLSVSSKNYDPRFEGVIAWMPLPEPYRAERRTDGKN